MHGLGSAANALFARMSAAPPHGMHGGSLQSGLRANALDLEDSVSASQLPLHTLVFTVACKLASAQEYSHYGLPATQNNLPKKESALQVISAIFLSFVHLILSLV